MNLPGVGCRRVSETSAVKSIDAGMIPDALTSNPEITDMHHRRTIVLDV